MTFRTPFDSKSLNTAKLSDTNINALLSGRKVEWKHIITAGCSGVLTSKTYGETGDGCWKGFTDDEINSMFDERSS